MQINHIASPTKSSSEAESSGADDLRRPLPDDRWPTPSDIAQYLESHGNPDLAIRVRGYTAREEDRPTPFNETALVFFVVFVLIPFSIATYAGTAFATRVPQRVLRGIAVVGLVTWLVRTPMLFRATHEAPRWRVALAHGTGLLVAVVMAVLFAIANTIIMVSVVRFRV